MEPYYQEPGITIYHGDCRDILMDPDFPMVDLVNTDPPYNVGKYYGAGSDDNMPEDYYWEWYRSVFSLIYGFMNGSALLYVSSTTRQTYEIKPLFESIGLTWLQNLIWYRPNMICWKKMFVAPWSQLYEPIGLFVKGKRPKMVNDRNWGDVRSHDVLIFASPQSNTRESEDHPTQKPIKLYKTLLVRSPGALILDPFMGSGTTLRAAKDLGKKAIGIDIEEKYCEVAANRMSQEVMDLGTCSAEIFFNSKLISSIPCGNCGTYRDVFGLLVVKCPNCGDDEHELPFYEIEEE